MCVCVCVCVCDQCCCAHVSENPEKSSKCQIEMNLSSLILSGQLLNIRGLCASHLDTAKYKDPNAFGNFERKYKTAIPVWRRSSTSVPWSTMGPEEEEATG